MATSARTLLPTAGRVNEGNVKAYQIQGLEPFGVPLRRNTAIKVGQRVKKRNRRSR